MLVAMFHCPYLEIFLVYAPLIFLCTVVFFMTLFFVFALLGRPLTWGFLSNGDRRGREGYCELKATGWARNLQLRPSTR